MRPLTINESREQAFDRFIENGKTRICRNREFCGITISDYVDHLMDSDDRGLAIGLIRYVTTVDTGDVNSLPIIQSHQEFIRDSLDSFLMQHKDKLEAEFNAQYQEALDEQMILAAGF
ncbi:hypothetical protein TW81_02105 [Vibrio galatheae]|uniref:Uncharacterized protein n=1 Tax=Vibrio galatheae TaxID=579748 RepID=A0A0F4NRU0_9VIBR|nr:hypothetical protein [Vibrio galatheae]KJY84811.1 hypothetical protein TW81_02105 [Vibrio galatheae]